MGKYIYIGSTSVEEEIYIWTVHTNMSALSLLFGCSSAEALNRIFRCFRHYRSYGGYSLLRLLTLPSYAAGLWQLHLAWGSVLRLLRLLYLQ